MVKSMLENKGRSWYGRRIRIWRTAGLIVLAAHSAFIAAFLVPRFGQLDFLKLHHTAEYGVDWIGRWYFIFTFPLLGAAAAVLNGTLAERLALRQRPFAEFVIQASFFLQVNLAVAGTVAVLLNA